MNQPGVDDLHIVADVLCFLDLVSYVCRGKVFTANQSRIGHNNHTRLARATRECRPEGRV